MSGFTTKLASTNQYVNLSEIKDGMTMVDQVCLNFTRDS
jgi:hypothetical protein